MLNRNALMLVAGAAIFALDASAASAQVKPPVSTKRIPIGKEPPQQPAAVVRVDTQMVYRTDTLRLPGRTDTVRTTNTVTRYDTTRVEMPLVLEKVGGLYFGLGAGGSLPAANFNDSDHPGWRIEGLVGIDPVGSPFGVRLTGGYGMYEPHSYATSVLENAAIMNLALDGKLRILAIQPMSRHIQLYGIGGGTWNRFKDVLENNKGIMSIGDHIALPGRLPTADHEWHTGFGWNLGGGAEIGKGNTNLFLESRFSRFAGENTKISHVPVIIGMNWMF